VIKYGSTDTPRLFRSCKHNIMSCVWYIVRHKTYQEPGSGRRTRIYSTIIIRHCSFRTVVVGDEENSFCSAELCSSGRAFISPDRCRLLVYSRISKDMIAAFEHIGHIKCFFWVDRFESFTEDIRFRAFGFIFWSFCKLAIGVCAWNQPLIYISIFLIPQNPHLQATISLS
jgi:hypothetical protein